MLKFRFYEYSINEFYSHPPTHLLSFEPISGFRDEGGVFWGGYPAFTKIWGFQLYQNAPNPLDILVLSNIGIKSVSALSQQSSIIKDQEFDSIHWYKYN